MTAREVIMEGNEGYPFYDVIGNLTEDAILDCIKEYAKMKCKEVLELAAKKAITKTIYGYSGNTGSEYSDEYEVVDKDSILNAVDLNEFIR